MIGVLWHDILYQPLFNTLIWLYNNCTDFNLGLAVIYLTILLRLVLLPFTFVSERDKVRWELLNEEVKTIRDAYRKDPVLLKEMVRQAMRKHNIRPWAKTIVLGFQFLVLIVLYQVFWDGIQNKFYELYDPAARPDFINLIFMPIKAFKFSGFNLAETHNKILPSIVAVILFLEIYLNQRNRRETLNSSDIAFRITFPVFSFLALYWLPTVKSVFILTSIFFSIAVALISWPIRASLAKAKKAVQLTTPTKSKA